MSDALPNVAEFTVSALSSALKRTIEESFGHVRVRGEISGYKGPQGSGHCYFCLKDEQAVIDAIIWKGTFSRLRSKLQEGLEVVATGKVTTYPGRSKYQIVIEALEPAGVGALMALLEERRRRLAAEGLFEEARKKPLPYLPDVIGVVTSPTGAVIRDILHRLNDRFARRVLVWPVRVQGEAAADEIAEAIRGFNALPADGPVPRPDLLIVARGGGSLEDLWAFNEEVVVRAAAESRIPLISAVGHETDWTLIDFAADWRAPTPTAAAERAVPVRTDLLAHVATLRNRQAHALLRHFEAIRGALRSAGRGLGQLEELLALPRQRLDEAAGRLPRALEAFARVRRTGFDGLRARLSVYLLERKLGHESSRLGEFHARAGRALAYKVARGKDRLLGPLGRLERQGGQLVPERRGRLDGLGKLLKALSYQSVLARGFALVRDRDGRMLRSAKAIAPGMALDIAFADGHAQALAADVRPAADGQRGRNRQTSSAGREPVTTQQGRLFED